ncbi:immunity protein Tsi6 family protein [Asticcacaulis excentricus]|uniref:immunity protein Tsi6 family protein n=1 Tax=Asticcacaulis excentricus TaxID=78587 RepID=UPI0015627F1A
MLTSIFNQLEYLIQLDTKKTTDRGRLSEIIIGVQAAKEIEDIDMSLAELLCRVSAEVDKMQYSVNS